MTHHQYRAHDGRVKRLSRALRKLEKRRAQYRHAADEIVNGDTDDAPDRLHAARDRMLRAEHRARDLAIELHDVAAGVGRAADAYVSRAAAVCDDDGC